MVGARPVVQSQRAEYAETKPRGIQAGCTLGEVQKLWAVGQAAGPGGVAPRPLAANSASCTPCISGSVQTTRRESKWKGFGVADK